MIVQTGKALPQTGLTYTYAAPADDRCPDDQTVSVIGQPVRHRVKKKDTLLDIARQYNLGFNELESLYPFLDPWLPPVGEELLVPTMWVLPGGKRTGLVVNIAEMRLYHFLDRNLFVKNFDKGEENKFESLLPDHGFVRTYPVGIGAEDFRTPEGDFKVVEKRSKPHWYIPPSLQEKYAPVKVVPPGPENPLGDYFMSIGEAYGIHGTNNEWSIGRLVTHGCIRLYPEDIEALFFTVSAGTSVRIVYEPVKIGFLQGTIYAEVHPDIYNKIADFDQYAFRKLADFGLLEFVDLELFRKQLREKSGIPVNIGQLWPS